MKLCERRRLPRDGLFLGVMYGGVGLAFYIYSGQAEVSISPRFAFLMVAMTSVPLGLYMLIALVFRFRWPTAAGRWLVIAGVTAAYLFIALGYRLDGVLTDRTMALGDELARDIEDFKAATGAYPVLLDDLAADGRTLPRPALENAAFDYQLLDAGDFILSFPSVAFLTCARRASDVQWRCDD